MGGGMKDSPSSSSSSCNSSNSKIRMKQMITHECGMCEQGNHETKVCPWLYTRCKHVPCIGVRAFLRSTTNATYGKMFFKCTIPTCSYFEWFDDATDPCKAKMLLLPTEKSCNACGEDDHSFENCPLHDQLCFSSTCNYKLTLRECTNQHNKNIAYLKCEKCGDFTWASDAIFVAAKEKVRVSRNQMADLITNIGKSLRM